MRVAELDEVDEPVHTATGKHEGFPTQPAIEGAPGVNRRKKTALRGMSAVCIQVVKPGRFFVRDRCRIVVWPVPVNYCFEFLMNAGDHCAAPARWAMKASTSAAFQTVTDSPSLNGFGNFPSRTQRQIVHELTGNNPLLALVVAICATRITRCDMKHP